MLSRPAFTSREYNDQLKFARSFGISSAVLSLVGLSIAVRPLNVEGIGPINEWYYWVVYGMAIAQMFIFLLYIFIFHNYDSKQKGSNFVQLSLVISTLLIGASYAAANFDGDRGHDGVGVIVLAALWTLCALNLGLYLVRNFKMAPPADVQDTDDDPSPGDDPKD